MFGQLQGRMRDHVATKRGSAGGVVTLKQLQGMNSSLKATSSGSKIYDRALGRFPSMASLVPASKGGGR